MTLQVGCRVVSGLGLGRLHTESRSIRGVGSWAKGCSEPVCVAYDRLHDESSRLRVRFQKLF